jgi:hypothetical protein
MTRTLVNSIQPTAKNAFINSNFDIWQRGTSFTNPGTTALTADRWAIGGSSTNYTVSRVAFGTQSEVPNNPRYYLRCLSTGIVSARDLRQHLEGVGTFAGKTITLSFWARCVSGTYSATAAVGLLQSFGTGGSPSGLVAPTGQNITLTPNWTKYSFTIAVPSIVGKTLGTNNNDYVGFYVNTPSSGSFDAHFAQFMINEGSQALDWNLAGTNLEGDLAMCQRYCFNPFYPDNAASTYVGAGKCFSTTISRVVLHHPVSMRAAPGLSIPTPGDFAVLGTSGTPVTVTSTSLETASNTNTTINFNTASGLIAGEGALVRSNVASPTLLLTAEL